MEQLTRSELRDYMYNLGVWEFFCRSRSLSCELYMTIEPKPSELLESRGMSCVS